MIKFFLVLPEFYLVTSLIGLLLVNARLIKMSNMILSKEIFSQCFFFFFVLGSLIFLNKTTGFTIEGLFAFDKASNALKFFSVFLILVCFDLFYLAFLAQKLNYIEIFFFFLFSLLSYFLLINSAHLLSAYIVIELQTLCFYVLSAYKRNSTSSTDSGLKYFLVGSFASAWFLLGTSLIYVCTGTLSLSYLYCFLSFGFDFLSSELYFLILIGCSFVTIFLLFKVLCAPFHFWAVDVYEGAPLASTIFFSITPKISIFFFFIKWVLSLNILFCKFEQTLIFFGICSCLWGTLLALKQVRLKSLFIYSSIAQVGFLLCALALENFGGLVSTITYLFIYLIGGILVWGILVLFFFYKFKLQKPYDKTLKPIIVSDFLTFFKKNEILGVCVLISFFSIGGLPPFSGFYSKISVISALVNQDYFFLSILLILISSLSVFYYIRVIKIFFFEIASNTSKTLIQTQVVHASLSRFYVVLSFFLFFLSGMFFFPRNFDLLCEYIVLFTFLF